MQELLQQLLTDWGLDSWSWNLVIAGIALVTGLLLRVIFSLFVKNSTGETTHYSKFQSVMRHLGAPLNFFLPLFVFGMLLPITKMSPELMHRIGRAVEIFLIIGFAWILINAIKVAQDYVLFRFDIRKENNLRERKIRTQLQFLRRLLVAIIVLLTIAAVLLSFEAMRKVGTGLLTGVGIGGIIIGFAAQKSLGNLLAGFQIAFTQPIRIDDAVVVQGEFGFIEEITLTYVVVRIWDDRRMVLPITYFVEQPFQNWTRNSAQLLGTVMIHTDYTLPVDAVRAQLKKLLEKNPLWDRRVSAVQVTEATAHAMELRVLVSARNAAQMFDLRCMIREQLVVFIGEHFPGSLPKTRTELEYRQDSTESFKEHALHGLARNGH